MITFLSKIDIDTGNPRTRKDLANRDSMHRTIMRLFPVTGDAERARDALGVLFRVDERRDGISILVQSRIEPSWDNLPRGYVLMPPASKVINAMLDRVADGFPVRFRIQASPLIKHGKTTTRPDGTTGEWTEPVLDEPGQLKWFRKKAVESGMHVTSLIVTDPGRVWFSRKKTGDGRFHTVMFDGTAIITNPTSFNRAVEKGIGPGKTFGLGMISFAPARLPI